MQIFFLKGKFEGRVPRWWKERRLCVSVAAGYTSVDTDQSLAIFTNTEEEGEITQL